MNSSGKLEFKVQDTNSMDDLIKFKRDQFRVSMRRQNHEQIFKVKRTLQAPTAESPESMRQNIMNWYHRLLDDDFTALTELRAYVQYNDELSENRLKMVHRCEIYARLLQIWKEVPFDSQFNLDILTILVNLHSGEIFDDIVLLKDGPAMGKILTLLQSTQCVEIQESIFVLMANLVGLDNGTKRRLLADFKIFKILKSMWLNQLMITETSNLLELSFFLKNLVEYHPKHIGGFTTSELEDILPIMIELISLDHCQIVQYALKALENIIQQNDALIIQLLNKKDFFSRLMVLSQSNTRLEAIGVIMGCFIGGDAVIQLLISFDIFTFMQNIFWQNESAAIRKQIIWGMTNACATRNYQILQTIIKSDVIKSIFRKYSQFDAHSQREVIELVRRLALIQNADQIKYVINTFPIVDTVMHAIQNNILIFDCLTIIYDFAHRLNKPNQYDLNFAICLFNNKGLSPLLDKLAYSDDQEIAIKAMQIHEDFYT